MKIQRIVDDWLHADAPAHAPDQLLSMTLDRVAETSQQRVLWRRSGEGVRLSRQVLVLAAALVGASLLGALAVIGALNRPEPIQSSRNGWVAFTVNSADSTPTTDIYIVREEQSARRIIGSGDDDVDERCPAFGPDGARLAYGRAVGSDYGDGGHTGAVLVIADVDAQGTASTAMEIDVGGTFRPPCAVWSPDGRHLAFAVGQSEDSIASGLTTNSSEVWVARIDDLQITRIRDVFATDLEWSPDGRELAIASGEQLSGHNADLTGEEISLYTVDSGSTRTLPGTVDANLVTWSPDGSRIAYERSLDRPDATGRVDEHRELVVHELDSDAEQVASTGYTAFHGIGPVWSPTGERIVYQRVCETRWDDPTAPCREEHDVVVVAAGPGGSWRASDVTEVVMPQFFRQAGVDLGLLPFRVSWSPDGQSLLYVTVSGYTPSALVVVPTSTDLPPVVLADGDRIDSEESGLALPTQVWGRQPGS